MLGLLSGHGDMPLMLRGDFARCWASGHATGAAVEADAIHGGVVDDGGVVGVAHHGDVYVGHSAVIEEFAASPRAAEEADPGVAEAVVDSAVEADFRSPVAGVPTISVVLPSPVTWSPEQTEFWRLDPGAGNPEITVGAVSPITRNPKKTEARTNGLFINGQGRRTDPNGNAYDHLRA